MEGRRKVERSVEAKEREENLWKPVEGRWGGHCREGGSVESKRMNKWMWKSPGRRKGCGSQREAGGSEIKG